MNVLIINIGPHGDVLRTTILLNQFKNDNVYWLTSCKNIDILNSSLIKKIFFIENLSLEYFKITYDIVISLNEEYPFLEDVRYKKLIGVKKDGTYTEDSSKWFDMSLISKFGIDESNKLKKENRLSYNQILIEMVGGEWKGQEYIIECEPINNSNKIGLIKTVNGIWKSKKWDYFDELYDLLIPHYDVEFLELKSTVKEHINNINKCDLIVCPDTLGMHISIALKKKVISIFNTTSPHEIYDYGVLTKIINPLYDKYFYFKDYNEILCKSINIDIIFNKIREIKTFSI